LLEKKEYFGTACKRRFVEAASVLPRLRPPSILSPFASEVSERWLCEPCSGVQSGSDIGAYKNRPLSRAG
jgi:hypothetical protein